MQVGKSAGDDSHLANLRLCCYIVGNLLRAVSAYSSLLFLVHARNLAGTEFPAVSSSFCALGNLAGFSFCNQESDTVSGCQAVKFILALKNLGIWQVLFPAVSSSFCALRNLAGSVLSAASVSAIRNLIWCPAVKQLSLFCALKNLGIWQVLCFQQFPAVSAHSGIWQVLCFQQLQFLQSGI